MTSKLPEYKCTKHVRAAQIERITYEGTDPNKLDNVVLHLSGELRRTLSKEWLLKHDPEIGGYYVEYKDGYSSYSPRAAFEEGYVRLAEPVDYSNDIGRLK